MRDRLYTARNFMYTHRKQIERWAVYLLFFILLFFLHRNMSLNLSDDAIFSQELKKESLLQHISHLYFKTNGKIFTDTMAAIFTYLPSFIWKTVDIGVLFLIVLCADRLFITSRNIILSCFSILLLDFNYLTSAGYVASSVNYTWCTAALLVSLLPLKYASRFEKKSLLLPACWLAGLYAGNQEQAGAIVITVYTLFIVASLVKKVKIHRYIWIQYVITIGSLILLLTAPGHANKATTFNIFFIPDYLALDFFEKIIRGFTSTAAVILTGKNILWPLFCFLLMLTVWAKKRELSVRLVSLIPLAASLVCGKWQRYLPLNIQEIFSYYTPWSFQMPDYRYIDAYTYTDWKFYVPLALALFILGLVLLEILWIFGTDPKGIIILLILGAGFCSRIIMGFSPTLYGSSYRTFVFLCLALGFCIAILLDKLLLEADRLKTALGFAVTLLYVAATYSDSLKNIR